MPGSPPRRVKEPGTKPPPKTLLNSRSSVFNRISLSLFISFTLSGLEAFCNLLELVFQDFFSSLCTISSTTVFHSLHEVHCPIHLAYWVPHF